MKVLILDGNENHAVAATRSLGAAGHEVFVGSDASWSKAGWSRFARGSFQYPPPQEAASDFVDRIIVEVEKHSGALVLPMTERSTLPISEAREKILAAGGQLALANHEVVQTAFDKSRTTQIAKSLDVAIPRTTAISNKLEADRFAESGYFPVVLKPRSSEEATADGRILSTGAPRYARDRIEFLNAFDEMMTRCSALLVQEFVEGQGAGYFALMRHGELRAEFAHRRIRDVRPTGSGSAVRESVRPDFLVKEAALKILKELKWHGVAMVEFRVRTDGTPVFLEVNGRFWNSLALAVYAGVDFPAMLAAMSENGDVTRASSYRENVRCRWFLGDFRHLLEVIRGAPQGFPGRYPGRLTTLINFLKPVPGTFHDNFQLADPLPELGDWIDFVFRKLPSAGRTNARRTKSVNAQSRYSLS
jgi:predicted ATP-grasp superfamily ATP-dependent carboligase